MKKYIFILLVLYPVEYLAKNVISAVRASDFNSTTNNQISIISTDKDFRRFKVFFYISLIPIQRWIIRFWNFVYVSICFPN
jgi:hypothetical protein